MAKLFLAISFLISVTVQADEKPIDTYLDLQIDVLQKHGAESVYGYYGKNFGIKFNNAKLHSIAKLTQNPDKSQKVTIAMTGADNESGVPDMCMIELTRKSDYGAWTLNHETVECSPYDLSLIHI